MKTMHYKEGIPADCRETDMGLLVLSSFVIIVKPLYLIRVKINFTQTGGPKKNQAPINTSTFFVYFRYTPKNCLAMCLNGRSTSLPSFADASKYLRLYSFANPSPSPGVTTRSDVNSSLRSTLFATSTPPILRSKCVLTFCYHRAQFLKLSRDVGSYTNITEEAPSICDIASDDVS